MRRKTTAGPEAPKSRKALAFATILTVITLFGAVEFLIFRSYVESSRITDIFNRSVDSTTFLANVQREFFLYQRELMDSPVERWDGQELKMRRNFLMRQVDLLAHTSDSEEFEARVKSVRSEVMSINSLVRKPALLEGTDREIKEELSRRLRRLEVRLKGAFDSEETILFGTMHEATAGRERSQKFLVVLAALVFVVTSALIAVWVSSVRSRLSKAYSSLMDEMAERKILEAKLTNQAYHDSLTGLANRELFRNDLEKALARAERSSESVAVLFLDLDDFKAVNDTFGHEAGDILLKSVADSLREVVRPSDTAARLGGDEFAIILDGIDDETQAVSITERLLEALASVPVCDDGQPVRASVGVALSDGVNRDMDGLLNDADYAMYEAKQAGKNAYRLYDPEMARRAHETTTLEQDLQAGIASGQLELYYQPLVRLADRSYLGYEALVRWNHPTRGLMLPEEFIEMAEERGLIVELDRWVLAQACAQLKEWQDRDPDFLTRFVSVNISARHFEDADLVADVSGALTGAGLDPSSLQVEVTESTLMRDKEVAAATLRDLKKLGVSVSLDDFGTGYSSLSYLQNFELDTLKIDRSFVAGVAAGPEQSALCRAIVRLAQSLQLEVIAEGIESEEQAAALTVIGCRLGQGFLYSIPRPVHFIDAEIESRKDLVLKL